MFEGQHLQTVKLPVFASMQARPLCVEPRVSSASDQSSAHLPRASPDTHQDKALTAHSPLLVVALFAVWQIVLLDEMRVERLGTVCAAQAALVPSARGSISSAVIRFCALREGDPLVPTGHDLLRKVNGRPAPSALIWS